jgi:predicted helicase
MMAPYAIAHVKIGLKLHETGYRFGSEERARIYLTNALEPAHDFSGRFEFVIPALAHEAQAVNAVKRHQRFTIVVGNPPYSGISANMTEHAQKLVDAYKLIDGKALNERKIWLQDDYVKFIRSAQTTLEQSHIGILGYITNHGYLDNPTFRGMRQSLLATFHRLFVLDLHGNANKKERAPDGSNDNNVFDIRQGVAICLAICGTSVKAVTHAEVWGSREAKYAWLVNNRSSETNLSLIAPDSPFYFLKPRTIDWLGEYEAGWKVTDIFPVHGVGAVMARDSLTVAFDAEVLWRRVRDFASVAPETARAKYELGRDARDWKVETAQADVRHSGPSRKRIGSILYRPFDRRFTYHTGNSRGFYASPCRKVMSNMLSGRNLGLALSRSVEIGRFEHVFVTKGILGHHSVSLKEVNYLCPLWLEPADGVPKALLKEKADRQLNLAPTFLRALAIALALKQSGTHGVPAGLKPEGIFGYAYAMLHSRGYRSRYEEFLKTDFPRLPLPGSLDLFCGLAKLGGELVALHLVESPKLDRFITSYTGPKHPEVGRVGWSDDVVWLDAAPTKKDQLAKPGTIGFHGVPEDVWNFHIGGYQVCEKWLKDRNGRTLTAEDITHYHRIVIALHETIRIMRKIDEVIDAHGGWPGAFASGRPPEAAGG